MSFYLRFYGALANNLTYKYKDVHAAAAEVIGLLMKQLADVQKVECIIAVQEHNHLKQCIELPLLRRKINGWSYAITF